MLSIPLITDKNKSPIQSLLRSFKLVKTCWFRVLVILLIGYTFIALAMAPTLLGLIVHPWVIVLGIAIFVVALMWLLPFLFLLEGVIYSKLVDQQKIEFSVLTAQLVACTPARLQLP